MHNFPSGRNRRAFRVLGLVTVTVLAAVVTAPAASASPPRGVVTSRITVASDGTQANGSTLDSRISANGRYVAFVSSASNLVPRDTNRVDDVFLHDRRTGTTRRISVSATGTQANGVSRTVSISADGRYLAFDSWASNLVPGDTNGYVVVESHSPGLIPKIAGGNVVLRDLRTGRTELVSVPYRGVNNLAEGISYWASISATGRYVAFASWQSNLVPGDTNRTMDVFLRDRWTRRTTRVNVSSSGRQSSTYALGPVVSDNGRYVAFASADATLVRGDTNRWQDVFLRDLWTRTTTRVSVGRTRAQANGPSAAPQITPDGRYLAYTSYASNLVREDRNGAFDVFVRQLRTGDTSLASTSTTGRAANGASSGVHLSSDGRDIAYSSAATNLVPHDTNGRTDVFVSHRSR